MSLNSLYHSNSFSTSSLPQTTKLNSKTSSASSSTSPKYPSTNHDAYTDIPTSSSSPSKKRILSGEVEVHPRECAIIINYVVQSESDPIPTITQKILDIKPYFTSTNVSISTIFNELMSKYRVLDRIIKPAQLEQALLQLVQRSSSITPESASRKSRPTSKVSSLSTHRAPSEELLLRRVLSPSSELNDEEEVASIEMLDQYIELLYEDLPEKLKSAKLLLSLALRQELLPILVQNASLFSAMSRTLREDTKKNLELMATLITFFHQFAKHRMYVPWLTEHKLGDLCMKLLDQELKRNQVWEQEPPAFHLQLKQDVLIYGCISILYQMGHDLHIQSKMANRQISRLLIRWMKPVSIVMPFLVMLTQFNETKEQLKQVEEPILNKVIPLLQQQNTQIDTLKFLINLSHDRVWQEEMVRAGLVVILVDLFQSDSAPLEVELLMYQLSTDDRTKSIFSYTSIMPLILKKVSKTTKSKELSISLLALAINLSIHPNHADKLVQEQGVPMLMKRFLKTQEYLLLKWIRTLALHPVTHSSIISCMDPLLAIFSSLHLDHQSEVLGILAHVPFQPSWLTYFPQPEWYSDWPMDMILNWVGVLIQALPYHRPTSSVTSSIPSSTETPLSSTPRTTTTPFSFVPSTTHATTTTTIKMTTTSASLECPKYWVYDDEEIQAQLLHWSFGVQPLPLEWISTWFQTKSSHPLIQPLIWTRLDFVDDPEIHKIRFQHYNTHWLGKVKGTSPI